MLKLKFLIAVSFILAITVTIRAQEPALPAGLEEAEQNDDEPGLPPGLATPDDASNNNGEPTLPPGLGVPDEKPAERDAPPPPPAIDRAYHFLTAAKLTGFAEARAGVRTQRDPYHNDMSIGELRLQVDASRPIGPAYLSLRTAFLYDYDLQEHDIDLETGDGWLDLRTANLLFTPLHFIDIRAGRQILTWGTGDLVFINDLFPKDWKSFFIGRDDEYLKAPSDAVRVSFYGGKAPNLDLVYTPRFDADRHVDGSRLSFYNPLLGRRGGEDDVIRTDRPERWFKDYEFAARLFENVGGYELAAYYYRGFWKSPAGLNPVTQEFTFPKLTVYGASARGNFLSGIAYIEGGFYDSREDRSGENPFVDNSEMRFLVGYEQELARKLTGTFQYYAEHMLNHNNYLGALPPGFPARDKTRHTVTMRLRKELFREDLVVSLFTRYSPSDNDVYLRPTINYTLSDHWQVEAGGNFFFGESATTFLGQFEKNNSIHAAIRYNY